MSSLASPSMNEHLLNHQNDEKQQQQQQDTNKKEEENKIIFSTPTIYDWFHSVQLLFVSTSLFTGILLYPIPFGILSLLFLLIILIILPRQFQVIQTQHDEEEADIVNKTVRVVTFLSKFDFDHIESAVAHEGPYDNDVGSIVFATSWKQRVLCRRRRSGNGGRYHLLASPQNRDGFIRAIQQQ